MLKMRPQQMDAFRIERVLPQLYDDLTASGVLTTPRLAAGLPSVPVADSGPALQGAESVFRAAVSASLREDIRRAVSVGISSYHGMLLFSSFRFSVGPAWFEQPSILPILAKTHLSEQARLDAIYSALNGF